MEIRPELSRCPYPGCQQLVKLTDPGHQKTCGDVHHLLVMCKRYCKVRPEQNKPVLESCYSIDEINGSTQCVYCSEPLKQGLNRWPPLKCWCSEEHHLLWLTKFCESLNPDQRCKLEGCHKHVFVLGEDGDPPLRVYDFCGFSHSQQYWMENGLRNSSRGSFEGNSYISEPSVRSIIDYSKAYIRDRKKSLLPRFLIVDEHFFNKHPWEYLSDPGTKSCWIIAKCIKRKNGRFRDLKTKDGYHWKQQSGTCNTSECGNGVILKYRTYEKQKSKKEATAEEDCNRKFSMQEYSFKDFPFEEYCVIKLNNGSTACGDKPNERKRKGQTLQDSSSNLKRTQSFEFSEFSDLSSIVEMPEL